MVNTFNLILALTVLIIVFKLALISLWSWRLHLRHRDDRSFSEIFHMMFAPRTAADMSADMWKDYAPIQEWNWLSSSLCLAVVFGLIAANVLVGKVGQ
jgi:hypothetical protein